MSIANNLVQPHSAEYYYSIYLTHISLYLNATARPIPNCVGEVGPGTSLGAGITALLTGSNELYCFDIVKHTDLSKNIDLVYTIADFLKNKKIPFNKDHFPSYSFTLNNDSFPYFLSDSLIKKMCNPDRLKKIILALKGEITDEIKIVYIAPWQEKCIKKFRGSIDFIYSHSAMEHIDNIQNAYYLLYNLLSINGGMSHSIDLKSHNYSKKLNGHLGIPLNKWIENKKLQPYTINRKVLSEHIHLINKNKFDIVMHLRRMIHDGILRENLAKEFENISDIDLNCGNLFIQAIK